ncbi:SIS domain-containing protein [Silvanigrella paludirubra]|uniref:SIS domain-containing protein n=1 Tax=Silvanigrella paludirubra TaxID=2499159 RepID=A0A6N6VNT3_9BACT|nr:SIS domain-containing protein [Silvanigrella paludirubra]KAB8036818.1 SIS domain-containing protein [Silvanigrella paludirubra]
MNQKNFNINKPSEWMNCLSTVLNKVETKIEGNISSFDESYLYCLNLFEKVKASGNRVWWVGNGGSAAMCSHLSQDLMNKLKIKSLFLNDPALITCMANDFGYENVYSKPLNLMAEPNDILIAISSSGNSQNILSCVQLAKSKDMKVISLSGFSNENKLWNTYSDISFYLNSQLYGIVEVGHEALIHAIIETIFINQKL